jgi:hypothetical protein
VSVPRTQDRMWHDVEIPAETVELRGEVRAAVEQAVAPFAAEIGQREETPDSFPWQARYPLLGTCTATEEIAYHSSSMAGVYDGQCIMVPKALSFGSNELQAKLIPGLVTGDLVFAFATTEPDGRSDLSVEAMQTVAEETAEGFVVNGFLAFGAALDVSPNPRAEPMNYIGSPDVTLYLVSKSGHCHNFASHRAELWDRIAQWVATVVVRSA